MDDPLPISLTTIFRLRRMHEMQTIVTDVCCVCLSVCHVAQLGFTVQGSFGTAFAKSLLSLVNAGMIMMISVISLCCKRTETCNQLLISNVLYVLLWCMVQLVSSQWMKQLLSSKQRQLLIP